MDTRQSNSGSAEKGGPDTGLRTSNKYLCLRCNLQLDWNEKREHEDWHFAKDLQDDEEGWEAPTPQGKTPTGPPSQPSTLGALGSNQAVYDPPSHPPPSYVSTSATAIHRHTNPVIDAASVRARDEVCPAANQPRCHVMIYLTFSQQHMQNVLQNLQLQYNIYNAEIEPEHEAEYYCTCPIHRYQRMKWNRYGVQEMWSRAVMYPGQHIFLSLCS